MGLDKFFNKKNIFLGILTAFCAYFIFEAAAFLIHKSLHIIFLLLLSFLLSCALELPVAYVAKIGIHRKIATGIVMVAFFLFLIVLGLGAYKAVGAELNGFLSNLGGYFESFLKKFQGFKFFSKNVNSASLVEDVNKHASEFMSKHLSGGLGLIIDIVTVLFFTYYLVSEGYLFRKSICRLLPEKYQNFVLDAWDKSIEKSGAYIIARIILALFSSFVFTIISFALGLPYALILGLWYGVISQAIPVIGTYAGAALIVIVAANRGFESMIVVLISIFLFQLLADYLILPKISKYSLNIHPALMLLSVLIGTVVFGPIGALIGIPVVAIISSIFTSYNFVANSVVEHKLLDKPVVSSDAPLMRIKKIKKREKVKNQSDVNQKIKKPSKGRTSSKQGGESRTNPRSKNSNKGK